MALLDSQGIVLAVNRALSERFGVEPVNLVGEAYNTTIGLWDTSPAAQTFLSGVAGKVRRTVTRPDGARTLLEIASIPLLDGDGRPHQVVEVWEDITERVALQTQLVRVESSYRSAEPLRIDDSRLLHEHTRLLAREPDHRPKARGAGARRGGRHEQRAQAEELVSLYDDRVAGALLLMPTRALRRRESQDFAADHLSPSEVVRAVRAARG